MLEGSVVLPLSPPAGRAALVVDLHSHTNLSDGALPPRELIRAAVRAGVEVLALTDHDTMAAWPEAAEEAGSLGLPLLPGMEVSSRVQGKSLHLLAYFAPDRVPDLTAWQARRRELRGQRLARMVARLEELGCPIDPAALGRDADPRRTPGRPHLARALVEAGHVASHQEAFDRYLGEGQPAWVEDQVPEAAEAIALVHRLGGLAVVAHPELDGLDPALEELAGLGVDGVEAYHRCHSPEVAAHYRRRAEQLGLLVTGGSDFHGRLPARGAAPDSEDTCLGQVGLPPEEWERFARAVLAQDAGQRGGETA